MKTKILWTILLTGTIVVSWNSYAIFEVNTDSIVWKYQEKAQIIKDNLQKENIQTRYMHKINKFKEDYNEELNELKKDLKEKLEKIKDNENYEEIIKEYKENIEEIRKKYSEEIDEFKNKVWEYSDKLQEDSKNLYKNLAIKIGEYKEEIKNWEYDTVEKLNDKKNELLEKIEKYKNNLKENELHNLKKSVENIFNLGKRNIEKRIIIENNDSELYQQLKKEYNKTLENWDFKKVYEVIKWYKKDIEYLKNNPYSGNYENINMYEKKIKILNQLINNYKKNLQNNTNKQDYKDPNGEYYNKMRNIDDKKETIKEKIVQKRNYIQWKVKEKIDTALENKLYKKISNANSEEQIKELEKINNKIENILSKLKNQDNNKSLQIKIELLEYMHDSIKKKISIIKNEDSIVDNVIEELLWK